MNLFGKKKKEENAPVRQENLQTQQNQMSLPELPKLPEFPKLKDDDGFFQSQTSQLPSYPSNYSGEKFSRNAIKEAVSGKRGEEMETSRANESLDDEEYDYDEDEEMMQEPPKIMGKNVPMGSFRDADSRKPGEPVFVRIDEFEESIDLFNKSKRKVMEIEKLLLDMKRINEKEEKELKSWESEVQSLKKNFEKMDRNIFSKI